MILDVKSRSMLKQQKGILFATCQTSIDFRFRNETLCTSGSLSASCQPLTASNLTILGCGECNHISISLKRWGGPLFHCPYINEQMNRCTSICACMYSFRTWGKRCCQPQKIKNCLAISVWVDSPTIYYLWIPLRWFSITGCQVNVIHFPQSIMMQDEMHKCKSTICLQAKSCEYLSLQKKT